MISAVTRWRDRRAAVRLTRVLREWRGEPEQATADQFTVLAFLWLVRDNERKAELSARRATAIRAAE